MEVRQIRVADWRALRRLRLRALADVPGAFASTLEAELAFGDDVWRQRAGDDPAAATFIASERGADIGLARIFAEPEPPGRTHLVSMWVDAGHRRAPPLRAVGFRPTGECQPLPSGPAITESLMRLALAPGAGGGVGPGRGGRWRPGPRSARP